MTKWGNESTRYDTSVHRIDSLDWQRGLLTFAIMAYHFNRWEMHAVDASTVLEVSGILCVEVGLKISVQCVRESFAKQDDELVGGLLPRHGRHLPIFLDVAQG